MEPDEEQSRRREREELSDQMPTAAPAEAQTEPIVQFGGRVPASLRRRVKICAAAQELDAQDVLREALEEYLAKRNF